MALFNTLDLHGIRRSKVERVKKERYIKKLISRPLATLCAIIQYLYFHLSVSDTILILVDDRCFYILYMCTPIVCQFVTNDNMPPRNTTKALSSAKNKNVRRMNRRKAFFLCTAHTYCILCKLLQNENDVLQRIARSKKFTLFCKLIFICEV